MNNRTAWALLVLALLLAALGATLLIFSDLETDIEDGRLFGFIRSVEEGPGGTAILFDDATWLSGREGEDAAIEAGLCTEETRNECLPNDFFILNEDMETLRVPVAEDAEVVMETYRTGEPGDAGEELSIEDFTVLINNEELHWSELPYHVTVEDGDVVRIEEQYVP